MLFDRYEIHIPDFEELSMGSSSFPGAVFKQIDNSQTIDKQMLVEQSKMSHYWSTIHIEQGTYSNYASKVLIKSKQIFP